MIRRPPRSTRTDTLFPYTTLFRSAEGSGRVRTDSCPALTFPPALLAGPFLSQWERRRDLKEVHTHERTDPLRQSGPEARDLRPDPDRHRLARSHPLVVVRRDQEARDDQLSHVQARA